MHCKITKSREELNAFAVMFLTTPPFPNNGPSEDWVRPLAILAANDDKDGYWSWIALNKEEKDLIGEAMLEAGVNAGDWWWCELYLDDEAEIINKIEEKEKWNEPIAK